MKRLFMLLLIAGLVSLYTPSQELPIIKVTYLPEKRAVFSVTLDYILENEGYYAFNPNDKGGETYAGISRKYNPNWQGWPIIDKNKPLTWCTRLPELDYWVTYYYLSIWVKDGYFKLKDQKTANYLFDFRLHGQVAYKITKRTLNSMGQDFPVNTQMSAIIMDSINSVDNTKFLYSLKQKRIEFYQTIVKKDTNQRVFLNIWLKRTEL